MRRMKRLLLILAPLVILAAPAVARACEPYVTPHECEPRVLAEAGLSNSGKAARCIEERETGEHVYAQCAQSEREIHERGELERAEANRKYEERLHEIAEQQKREEQQQAEAKYAREHPTPQPPAVSPVQPEAVFPPLTLAGSSSFVQSFIKSRSHRRADHLSDKCPASPARRPHDVRRRGIQRCILRRLARSTRASSASMHAMNL